MRVPEGSSLNVDSTGKLIAEGTNGATTDLGSLQLVKINSPQSLQEVGTNLYQVPTELANQTQNMIQTVNLGQTTYSVQQGKLEGSNVDLANEMVQLTEAQRAYQFQARALSYSDQMMGMATRLRG
ncbi:flagellar hook-basal body complex protein [Tepidibacillus marianensis]|uniref:flagellar hook-basal body complex protein n=1 Tax=Tepidibacillus marianensis TaxID=3131995 RepID=UPI003870B903